MTMHDTRVVSLRLSKEGFGTVKEIEEMPSDMVLDALEYAGFLTEWQQTFVEINKEKD